MPISRDNQLYHFCSYNVVENETHFVLNYPLYNYIRDKFSSLFQNDVEGSLKSCFQSDHQVDITLYLTDATAIHYSREIPFCYHLDVLFKSPEPFPLPDFRIDSILLISVELSH